MIEKKDEQADYINPMRQLETTTVTKEQLLKLNQETNDFLRFKVEQLFKDAKSNEKQRYLSILKRFFNQAYKKIPLLEQEDFQSVNNALACVIIYAPIIAKNSV